MLFTPLSESVQTLYAEFLDQLRLADAELVAGGASGSYVSKSIRGRTYWYLQKSEGASKRQIYLGPESPAILAQMESREARRADEKRRRELVSMLAAGGMHREPAATGTVLHVLSEAGVFRAGGILVGTQSFTCMANLLGVTFDRLTMRTADSDVAVGVDTPDTELLERLRSAVSGFPREPSTSFKVRGRDLRVDFVTPRRRGRRDPVLLPHLGIAAQPLDGLDYLIEDSIDAAIVAGHGIRVLLPTPARFALHKLWVSSQRPVSEAAKSSKDIRQASALLDVLLDDRPGDVEAAWDALVRRGGMQRAVKAVIRTLDDPLRDRITSLLV